MLIGALLVFRRLHEEEQKTFDLEMLARKTRRISGFLKT